MNLFTSSRERDLWLWAGIVVLAIYSTLGAARVAVESLRERNLLRISVAVLFLAVAALLVVTILRRRPGPREIAVALGFAALYALVLVRMDRVEERLHILEYGLVAGLVLSALRERRRNGRDLPGPPWLLSIATATALGWIDEGIQGILPSRFYDFQDVVLNAQGGVLAVAAMVLLDHARRMDSRSR